MNDPTLSIVTTCKGRLHHLVKSLPTFLKQAATEVIVVDYDCPDNTASYLAVHFPTVHTVKATEAADFNVCRARNFGARAARGELLAFVDADVLLSGHFATYAVQHVRPGYFGCFGKTESTFNAMGTCVIPRSAFDLVNGYDEALSDYGCDDEDIYYRLKLSGLKAITLEPSLIDRVLKHGDARRTRHKAIKNLELNRLITSCYCQIKNMVLRLEGKWELDIDVRQSVYENVKAEVLRHFDGHADFNIAISVPPDSTFVKFGGFDVARMMAVTVRTRFPRRREPSHNVTPAALLSSRAGGYAETQRDRRA